MARAKIILPVLFLIFSSAFSQKDPHWLEGRNSIIELFQWKYQDVADECERFLQYKGYAGVQVGPASENIVWPGRPWWERYQPMSYILTTRSGAESDFLEMTTRCNAVGVRVYVDTVLNHMTTEFYQPVGTAGSTANPGNKEYPGVPYRPVDFHDTCSVLNYDDAHEVRNCEIYGFKDLDQSLDYVRERILTYLNHMVDFGVAGFRLEGAKFMNPVDLEYISQNIKNLSTTFGFPEGARPFVYMDINDLDRKAISSLEYIGAGKVYEFDYISNIGGIFRGNAPLASLSNWAGPEWDFMGSGDAIVFIDYHDTQRGDGLPEANILNYKQPKQYKMATAFMLAHPYGTTRIMSSFAFEDPVAGPPMDANENVISPGINADDTCSNGWICEHRWRQIYNMVGFRNAVAGTDIQEFWTNGDQQISFCRGNKGFIALNNGGDLNQSLQTCLPAGNYCDIISGNIVEGLCTGKTVTVGEDGFAQIVLLAAEDDGILAIHLNSFITV